MTYRQQIFDFVKEKYKTTPEYLWKSSPSFAVLRRQDNKKWYAVIMNISKSKLGLKSNVHIDVMNIKADTFMIGSLLCEKGFYPVYHMNKNHWVSVLLDGTVDFENIMRLVDISFENTNT